MTTEPIEVQISNNFRYFNTLIQAAGATFDQGNAEKAARLAQDAAYFAWYNSTGLFGSRDLEELLARISHKTVKWNTKQAFKGSTARGLRVLHVMTVVYFVGGHSRVVWRWIRKDSANSHSVALTQQGTTPVPPQLLQAVQESGGILHNIGQNAQELLDCAQDLATISHGYDLVVLHHHPHDVVPNLAFSNMPGNIPVIYLNHASHVFWLGACISNIVVSLMETFKRLCIERRGLEAGQCMLLPLPIELPSQFVSREEARKELGFDGNEIILFSSGSPYKYKPASGVDFSDFVASALQKSPLVNLVVAGPVMDDYWRRLEAIAPGRVKLLGYINEEKQYGCYRAADIYLDSIPFGSATALLEAACHGLPVISFAPEEWQEAHLGFRQDNFPAYLHFFSNPVAYRERLDELILNPDARKFFGNAVAGPARHLSVGPAWIRYLEDIYQKAFSSRRAKTSVNAAFPKIANIDVLYQMISEASGTATKPPLDIRLEDIAASIPAIGAPPGNTSKTKGDNMELNQLINKFESIEERLAASERPESSSQTQDHSAAIARPTEPALSPQEENILYEKACELIESGDSAKAIESLRVLVNRQAIRWDIYNDLGSLLYAQGDISEAIDMLRAGVSLEFTSTISLRNLATIYASQGEIGKTLAACSLIAKREPDDGEIPLFVMDLLKSCSPTLDTHAWLSPEIAQAEKDAQSYAMALPDIETWKLKSEFFDFAVPIMQHYRNNEFSDWAQPEGAAEPVKLYQTCSSLSDDQWQKVLLESVTRSIYRGVRMPGFPKDELQVGTVGSSGETTLQEAFRFYKAIKSSLALCGHPLNADSSVLDFGCGWGRYTRYFLKDVDSRNLYGIDVDPMLVDVCKQTFPYGNFLAVNSVPPTSLPSGKFDLILAYSVFSHLAPSAADRWIEEFSRLLSPGGVLAVTTQGRTFINFCKEIRESGNIGHPWHQNLAKSFIDTEACLEAYDKGEFLFAPTGGGDARPSTFYGEALVPRQHAETVWGQWLEFRDFIDDRSFLPQALIVMQKSSGRP